MEKVFTLKAAPDHPTHSYRIGRHLIGADFAQYALNDEEIMELGTEGPKRWVVAKGDEAQEPVLNEALKPKKKGK